MNEISIYFSELLCYNKLQLQSDGIQGCWCMIKKKTFLQECTRKIDWNSYHSFFTFENEGNIKIWKKYFGYLLDLFTTPLLLTQ